MADRNVIKVADFIINPHAVSFIQFLKPGGTELRIVLNNGKEITLGGPAAQRFLQLFHSTFVVEA